MKGKFDPKERGQALVIIAFAAVALVAFVALAIDGSAVFSDRRHSQNASDTSVLAAALAKVRNDPNWQTTALARAADNKYDDNDPETEVIVSSCAANPMPVTEDGVQVECRGLPTGADPSQYIVVHIKSIVHLTFARVIGRYTVTNHTDAVSRATDPEVEQWYDGYAIASLHEGCKSPGDGDPFELGGNAEVNITGAGVLVNASCPTQDSLVQSGTSSTMVTADGGTCVVGTADNTTGITPPPQEGCPWVDPAQYQLPSEPQCANAGVITGSGGVFTATPGYYDSEFPDVSGGQVTVKLTKGVYCLNDGIRVNAGWTVTTDLDGDGHDNATEGVLLYVPGGDITFNGGADVTLHAISASTSSTFSPYWLNLLIFVPPSNEADIQISGNSGSQYTGTILAPSSHVELTGNGGSIGLDSKIISDTVKITGSTEFDLSYNDSNNSVTLTSPGIELIE
ncbi:MAG: hypothetical protein C3F07_17620 [Anaerolineales bacterium]|nr:hypothetical protein [Anaerolineae bacterium]PWB70147.1 MAG: hypothetical protein C3F07_17620 [Anaerolineales bacterium]